MLTVILNSRHEIYADSAAQHDVDLLLTAFLNRHESGADGATQTTDTNLLRHESTTDGATQQHA